MNFNGIICPFCPTKRTETKELKQRKHLLLEMVDNRPVISFSLGWLGCKLVKAQDYLQWAAAEGKTKTRAHDIQISTLLLTNNQNCTVHNSQEHMVKR